MCCDEPNNAPTFLTTRFRIFTRNLRFSSAERHNHSSFLKSKTMVSTDTTSLQPAGALRANGTSGSDIVSGIKSYPLTLQRPPPANIDNDIPQAVSPRGWQGGRGIHTHSQLASTCATGNAMYKHGVLVQANPLSTYNVCMGLCCRVCHVPTRPSAGRHHRCGSSHAL